MLILAGVTINIALGDNGLFNKSKQAVEKYKESERNEIEVLDDMDKELGKLLNAYGGSGSGDSQIPIPPKEIAGSKTSEIISKITGKETENTKVTIGGQDVIIPAGFTISTESAEQVSGGIVVKDKKGNEWVWVSCTSYERHDFGKQNGSYSNYSEEETESITNQKASITKNKGYYIGRYEAGNDGSDNVIIQKDKTPYGNILIADCIAKSNSFAVDNNYDTSKMFTTLCSSYAWDQALLFIEQTNSGYATNSAQGNYSDHKFSDSQGVINTGLTIAVSNIYDMGGNLCEYTTEPCCSAEPYHYVERGGFWLDDASDNSAGYRGWSIGNAYDYVGFRPTLFLK